MKATKILTILVLVLGLAAEVAKADFTFGTPTNLGQTVNSSSSSDLAPYISANSLELYFVSTRPEGSGAEDLWVATRMLISEPWSEPVNLGPVVNSSSKDSGPYLSADGLELYFHSTRPNGLGGNDIWLARRATPTFAVRH